jgi:CheY-like chemotaxis protein
LLDVEHATVEERRDPPARSHRIEPDDSWPAVFVVDDDAFLRALVGDWVEDAGFRAVRLPGGEACLAALLTEDPLAVVLDLHMSGMCGATTLDAIRVARPHLPVIALTAETDPAFALDLIERGASEFLAKPVRRNQLVRALLAAAGQEAVVAPPA